MLKRIRPRLTFANVFASIALFVALGGASYAAIRVGSKQIVNNSIRSQDIRNNSVRSKDIRNGSLLAGDFKRGQLRSGRGGPRGARGPRGPRGLRGAKGDPGTSATVWAVVSETDAIVRSKGGATISKESAGIYRVAFPGQDLRSCAAIASVSATEVGDSLQPGEAAAKPSPTTANTVRVGTFNSAGASTDKPFEVAVFC
jgi:hypothetical protein